MLRPPRRQVWGKLDAPLVYKHMSKTGGTYLREVLREVFGDDVAEAPWSVAEWAVALRFDNPRATVLVLLLG